MASKATTAQQPSEGNPEGPVPTDQGTIVKKAAQVESGEGDESDEEEEEDDQDQGGEDQDEEGLEGSGEEHVWSRRILTEEEAKLLAEGFLGHLTPMLEQITAKLVELQHGQVELLGQFQDAGKLVSHPDMDHIMATLSKLPQYYGKLRAIYEEMIYLKEKSARMKKRAIKMQRKRQEDEVKDEINRRKVSEKEQQLTAKYVDNSGSS